MSKLKNLGFLLLTVLFLSSCGNKGNEFTVIGDIANMPRQQVVLEELGMREFVLVDSVMSDEKGHFELKGNAPEEGRYRVKFSNTKFIILTIDKGNIKVAGDFNDLQNYTVSGSPSSESFRVYMQKFRSYVNDINTLEMAKNALRAQGNDSTIADVERDQADKIHEMTRFIEQYADTTKSVANALFAAQMLNPKSEIDYINAFVGGLERRFPKSNLAKEYVKEFNSMMAKQAKEESVGPTVGGMAPDITLTSTEGKQVAISSYKGKYVLVDFWASWCGPCRAENPNVVAAYNKYKDKNFTILGISLDDDRTNWMKAIEKDKLFWTHISDLKGWESAAARLYGIQSIPANFLLDPAGKIIARDLRGPELEAKLAEVLNGGS
ncbi:MAG: AhpC/TSA family protein [Flavipsychrobacter sp.]|nr:AhpC/TSA family protein [Flavipsychrobacter sp.]